MLHRIVPRTPTIPDATTTAPGRTLIPIPARPVRVGSSAVYAMRVKLGYLLVWPIVFSSILVHHTATARDNRLSDAQVRERIVQESVNAYLASGKPCACPYNIMRNGQPCGARSAYSRPGGAAPQCYLSDVSTNHVTAWRARNRE